MTADIQQEVTRDGAERVSVLLVEDNPGDARLFKHHINTDRSTAFPATEVTHVEDLATALEALGGGSHDLVLLDLGLPGSTGVETLDQFQSAVDEQLEIDPVPVVVLTGLEDDEVAVESIERGAQDYLVKDDVNRKILNRTIRYAIERHQQELKLRRQRNRFKEFASVVSHDLRNPLNAAQLRLELIEDEETAVVEQNLDRMEAIIEDMLTLARTGQEVTDLEEVNLSDLVRRCWTQVPTADASMTVEDDIILNADARRCEQLLENIIRNSIEHGGETVTVRVAGTQKGFLIEDDGPGIPESDREKVFETGYTSNPSGTGFGLNIVEAIAMAHGWTVRISDGTDGGARFEFVTE